MRTCSKCADDGHAYKITNGIIMCLISQKFMVKTEICVYSVQDLSRKCKEFNERANRLDALFQSVMRANEKEEL